MIPFSVLVVWLSYVFFLYLIIFWLLVFLERNIVETEEKMEIYPNVTIAIPAYNEEKNISETINSVLRLDYPREKLEVIIVNDGSTDNTKEIVEKIITENPGFNIKLISQNNHGKGSALNGALKIADGEFFTTMDSDSIIRQDALKKVIPRFKDNDVAAVLPLMKVFNPKNLLQKIQWCEYLVNLFYKRLMSILDCVHVAPGPFSTYRKETIKNLGGFDENNLVEDLELTLRLQKNHYKIIQVFNTEVYTKAPETFKAFYKQRNRWYKGTFLNALKYRNMAFNKKYGDFGFIQMPRILLESVAVLFVISVVLYSNLIQPLITKIKVLSLTDFNFVMPLKRFMDNFAFINLDLVSYFYAVVLFILALFLIKYAHKHANEPLSRYGYITIPSYLLFYSVLASIVLFGVFLDLVRGKLQKW